MLGIRTIMVVGLGLLAHARDMSHACTLACTLGLVHARDMNHACTLGLVLARDMLAQTFGT